MQSQLIAFSLLNLFERNLISSIVISGSFGNQLLIIASPSCTFQKSSIIFWSVSSGPSKLSFSSIDSFIIVPSFLYLCLKSAILFKILNACHDSLLNHFQSISFINLLYSSKISFSSSPIFLPSSTFLILLFQYSNISLSFLFLINFLSFFDFSLFHRWEKISWEILFLESPLLFFDLFFYQVIQLLIFFLVYFSLSLLKFLIYF